VELRVRQPMLDLSLFRRPSFVGVMLGAFALNAAGFAALAYSSLWLQSILGLSPLQGGLVFIPLSAVSFAVAAGAGRYVQTLPPRFVLGAGLALIGAASFLMAMVSGGSSWTVLVPGLAVLGVGVGMANPVLASAALAAVPRERSGMASGAVNTARQLGFALGVAVLGSVFTARAASLLADAGTPDPSGTASALTGGQAGQLIGSAAPGSRAELAGVLADAYAGGLREVFLACGVAGLLGGLLVVWLVRAGAPGEGHRPAPEPAEAQPVAR
jgi:predicted MFS family arabinose efflux permease